jgi:hypothetical protein
VNVKYDLVPHLNMLYQGICRVLTDQNQRFLEWGLFLDICFLDHQKKQEEYFMASDLDGELLNYDNSLLKLAFETSMTTGLKENILLS